MSFRTSWTLCQTQTCSAAVNRFQISKWKVTDYWSCWNSWRHCSGLFSNFKPLSPSDRGGLGDSLSQTAVFCQLSFPEMWTLIVPLKKRKTRSDLPSISLNTPRAKIHTRAAASLPSACPRRRHMGSCERDLLGEANFSIKHRTHTPSRVWIAALTLTCLLLQKENRLVWDPLRGPQSSSMQVQIKTQESSRFLLIKMPLWSEAWRVSTARNALTSTGRNRVCHFLEDQSRLKNRQKKSSGLIKILFYSIHSYISTFRQ